MADNAKGSDSNQTGIKQTPERFFKPISDRFNSLNLPPLVKNKYFLITASLLTVMIIIYVLTSVSAPPVQVPTYTVNKDNFLVAITESGEIRAKNSVPVNAPRVRGSLKIVFMAPEGEVVKPGDDLIKFDATESIAKVREEEAKLDIELSEKKKLVANHSSAVANMRSKLESAEISFELSKLKLEKIKYEAEATQQEQKLQFQKDKISYVQTQKEYESMISIHESELAMTNKKIEQQRLELEEEQRELASLTLNASYPGLVVYSKNWNNMGRKFAVGDDCWRGANIITLPDLSVMESLTFVNEVDISKVHDSLSVEVKLDAFQDSMFIGSISQVASLGREKGDDSNLKVFEVVVALSDSSDILKPGMTTSNRIIINEISDVLFIPHESIFESEGNRFVFVQNGSSYDRLEVTVGEKSEDFIVITSGLKEGDIIALRDPDEDTSMESNQAGKNGNMPGS
jgi:multidrug efflux pump subunit AcrA (membrane-fusion protein)